VSKELAGLNEQPVRTGAAVYLSRGVGIMVNEEDHLRLQACTPGSRFGRVRGYRAS